MKYRLLAITVLIVTLQLPVTAQTHRYARVVSPVANLRDAPTVTSTDAEVIAEETVVKILDQKLPWYIVRIGNRVGWMHGNLLEFVAGSGASASEPYTEQKITPDYTPSTTRRRSNATTTPPPSGGYTPRSSSSNSHYIRGPRGGCYYISGSGRKVYVDRSMCN